MDYAPHLSAQKKAEKTGTDSLINFLAALNQVGSALARLPPLFYRDTR